ncbi:hypothetical protein kam1_1888 [Methylacidiphilum kamchatkense Kam1]|uniref:Uncharacterized protein n=1 Tax=Methylacidiphilum kamchatkense Kam1 TaxID=1202785 RepID=A0A516TPD6_9BACT|nr:hypothetical protein kam1_1888 [Methylacidiphilum kamchatkense Kam1]
MNKEGGESQKDPQKKKRSIAAENVYFFIIMFLIGLLFVFLIFSVISKKSYM